VKTAVGEAARDGFFPCGVVWALTGPTVGRFLWAQGLLGDELYMQLLEDVELLDGVFPELDPEKVMVSGGAAGGVV
jgi:hypothetical protein